MNKCSIIYNPISTGFNIKVLEGVTTVFERNGFNIKLIKSRHPNHIQSIIPYENDNTDLIITLGGDGTYGEAIQGFNECEQKALYSHVAVGTSNDVAKNFNLSTNPILTASSILTGKEKDIDIINVNNTCFGYVSCFGALTDIPCKTKLSLKKRFGKNAYLISAIPDIFKLIKNKIPSYNITYNKNDELIRSNCLMGFVSNSKGFSNVNIYPNADISDGLFEVMIIKNVNNKFIFNVLKDYLLNKIDLNKYNDFIDVFKTKSIDICFNGTSPKRVDNDGDIANIDLTNNGSLSYRADKKIKMLLPKL